MATADIEPARAEDDPAFATDATVVISDVSIW